MAKWMALLLVLVLVVCSAAFAQDEEDQKEIPIALTYQIYYPSSSETQDLFGNAWKGFGLSVIQPQQTEEWRSTFSFNAISASGTNDASLYSVSYGYQKGFGQQNSKTQPFVLLAAGPYYGNVDVPSLGIDESKLGLNANATVGVLFNERFVLSARYDYYSRIEGLSFDGITFSVGLKLFDL